MLGNVVGGISLDFHSRFTLKCHTYFIRVLVLKTINKIFLNPNFFAKFNFDIINSL